MIDRRTFLAAAALTATGLQAARADEAAILRLAGTLTKDNYLPFTALMTDSADGFVGLKILVASKGGISAKESGGKLTVDLEGSGVVLDVESGFRSDDRGHFLEGFYRVQEGGVTDGVSTILIAPARTMDVEATGKPVKLVEIDNLIAGTKN